MLTVYKYNIPIEDYFELDLPINSKILCFQIQNEKPTLWVLVNPYNTLYRHKFRLFGTGHPISEDYNLSYIGTCQMMEGALIWHLFELI